MRRMRVLAEALAGLASGRRKTATPVPAPHPEPSHAA